MQSSEVRSEWARGQVSGEGDKYAKWVSGQGGVRYGK